MSDNIAAISTAQGVSGIAIIRLSGPDVISIVNNLLNINLEQKNSNTINYARLSLDGHFFDEVLVSIFKAPNTFTGENVVEINTHGGIYITQELLKYLIKLPNVRLAQAGEFSKRAYLNGKKTLNETQVIDKLINAKTKLTHDLAINQLSGKTNKLLEDLRQKILSVIAEIEVNIDYPEYEDITEFTTKMLEPVLKDVSNDLNTIIEDSHKGELLSHGINTAIIGAPNVGKSSLLNNLSRTQKAIVTSIQGTTRDVIESQITLGNVILNLYDTAGIRDTEDEVEKIGIEKSQNLIEKVDLVLFILDASRELEKEEIDIYKSKISKVNHLVIINKIDEDNKLIDKSLFTNTIEISAKNDTNIDKLEQEILNILNLSDFNSQEARIINNINDIAKLEQAKEQANILLNEIKNDQVLDIIELELKDILFTLGEILNIDAKTNLIDELFSRFCLGK